MSTSAAIRTVSGQPFDIIGIGVSVWDSVLLVDAFPQPGQVVQASRRIEGIGGGITVAMATAARLGSSVAMIDSLGDDQASLRILQSLDDEGVNVQCIVRSPGRTASIASIWTDSESCERTIVYLPGSASEVLQWNQTLEHLVSQAKIIHLNGRHPQVCLNAIRVAKESGVKISFDGGAYRYRDEILPMLESAEIAIVAKQFAEMHYRNRGGKDRVLESQQLAEFLITDLDCELAAVTDGAVGSFVVPRNEPVFHQPAVAVERAVDTTGCGDTYHGAFLHAYASGQNAREAASLASKIASDNAQAMGALAFGRLGR